MFELEMAALASPGVAGKSDIVVARAAPRLALALVTDGICAGSETAGAGAVAADDLTWTFAALGGPGRSIDETRARLERGVEDALDEVSQRIHGPPKSMVALVVAHGAAVVVSVGHTRCYRLRGRELSPVLVERPPSAASGAGPCHPEAVVERCEPDDVLLLASGGLWRFLEQQSVCTILAQADDAQDACRLLLTAAGPSGGGSSVGVAVVRLVPLGARVEAPWLQEEPPGAPIADWSPVTSRSLGGAPRK